jgi:hypothetical protein
MSQSNPTMANAKYFISYLSRQLGDARFFRGTIQLPSEVPPDFRFIVQG